MKTVILAAGYATRLYPLTLNKPKCLLEVGGRTILDRLCVKLERIAALEQTVIVTNTKFYDQLKSWAQKAKLKSLPLLIDDKTVSNEVRLGAIGDLELALKSAGADADILMLASDNLFEEDFSGFMKFCQGHKNEIGIGVYDIKDPLLAAGKFGVIEADTDGKVLCIEEKPAKPKSSLIGMGVYYFPKSTLPLVRDYLKQKEAKDAPGYYIRWLSERQSVYSYRFSGMWFDIGNLEALEEADRLFLSR